MKRLQASILNETERLFSKKKTTVFLIIMAALIILSLFFLSTIQSKLAFMALSAVSFPILILSVVTNIFLPLFIFMSISEVFSSEVENKTLKITLVKPISRFKVFISKNIAVLLYTMVNLLVVFSASFVGSLFLSTRNASISTLPQSAFAYFISIVPAAILILFASFISQFFKNSSGTQTTCIFLYLAMSIVTFIYPHSNNFLFTSYLNWHSLWLGGSATLLRAMNVFFLLLSYGIIFFTAGYYLFDKKEL